MSRKSFSPGLKNKVCAGVSAFTLFFMASSICGATGNERGLWALWQLHSKEPENHAAALAACENFIKANSQDSFAAIAQTLAAWHLLKTGRIEEARAALTPWLKASSDPVHMGARELARAWLTRLDIEDIRASLQQYYRMEVRYPETLADIAAHPRIPASQHPVPTDRWGRAWIYRLEDFKSITGFRGQRYRIESPMLGASSSLAAALKTDYADRIRIKPARVIKGATPMLQFHREVEETDAKTVTIIQLGSMAEDLFLAHLGPRLIVICDRFHWRVLANPTPSQ